jgi:hypothetical protein
MVCVRVRVRVHVHVRVCVCVCVCVCVVACVCGMKGELLSPMAAGKRLPHDAGCPALTTVDHPLGSTSLFFPQLPSEVSSTVDHPLASFYFLNPKAALV